jgi:uncharacterized protein (TIGR00251 family)
VRVTPRAAKSGIAGYEGGVLSVRVAAPPVEGEANEELVRVLARVLGVPRTAIAIRRGSAGRVKDLSLSGIDEATLAARLAAVPALAGTGAPRSRGDVEKR